MRRSRTGLELRSVVTPLGRFDGSDELCIPDKDHCDRRLAILAWLVSSQSDVGAQVGERLPAGAIVLFGKLSS
jgi:hypothetical protein